MDDVRHVLMRESILWGLLVLVAASAFLLKLHDTGPVKTQIVEPLEEFRSEAEAESSQLLDNKIRCMQSSGWSWREYESIAWCESYHPCGQPVPECPDGNEPWTNIRDNSHVCESTKAAGYRVYCHPDAEQTTE